MLGGLEGLPHLASSHSIGRLVRVAKTWPESHRVCIISYRPQECMLRDLEKNQDDGPDKELKKILEPKVTESATTEVKKEEVDAAKKKVRL
jgi:hypothetical protein